MSKRLKGLSKRLKGDKTITKTAFYVACEKAVAPVIDLDASRFPKGTFAKSDDNIEVADIRPR